uniref:General transcription factor IIF subunit 2 n=1 Tax=Sus scrofa TaxID=9823 RepID=A0A4X1SDX6_PIG
SVLLTFPPILSCVLNTLAQPTAAAAAAVATPTQAGALSGNLSAAARRSDGSGAHAQFSTPGGVFLFSWGSRHPGRSVDADSAPLPIRGLPCAPVVRPAVHPAPGAADQVCTPPLATDPWLSAGNSTSRAPNRTLECGWSRFLNICHSSGLKPLEEVKLGNYGLPNKLSLEGIVVQRAECRPAASENYMRLKRLQIEESSKPVRLSQQLDKVVTTNYKPVANHQYNIEYERKKKEDGKRARADKQYVLDMLFSAFEKHQYYNLKDLVDITKQPVSYLKEILKEIGIQNVKGIHKNTWELKPEYRHYQAEEKSD